MRFALAAACSSMLLGSTAPQRAQHEESPAAQNSALISGCAVFYDTADRTLNIFRTIDDCSRRIDVDVWRQMIPVAEPQCSPTGQWPLICSENGPDSSFLPPCVATLTWQMSFFSGVHCDLDAPSLVLRGRVNECDQCEVDARGGGSSHRYAHAFHSLIADGIIAADELTVVREGSPAFDAAGRVAEQGLDHGSELHSDSGSWDDEAFSGSWDDESSADLTPPQRPALLTAISLERLLLLMMISVLLTLLLMVMVGKSVSCGCLCCCCPTPSCRSHKAQSDPDVGAPGQQKGWLGVAQEDSAEPGQDDYSTVSLVRAEKLELDDIM